MAPSVSGPSASTGEDPVRPTARWVSTRKDELVSPVLMGLTGVEIDISNIFMLPVVRKLGHEWNFSFLWVNVSQSSAIATDGKILYRARSSHLPSKWEAL